MRAGSLFIKTSLKCIHFWSKTSVGKTLPNFKGNKSNLTTPNLTTYIPTNLQPIDIPQVGALLKFYPFLHCVILLYSYSILL